jgi:hypothetical protein
MDIRIELIPKFLVLSWQNFAVFDIVKGSAYFILFKCKPKEVIV